MQKLFWISGACLLGLACSKAEERGSDMDAVSAGHAAEHAAGHSSDDKADDKADDKGSGARSGTGGRAGSSAAGAHADKPKDDMSTVPDAGCVEEPAGMMPGGMMKMMPPPGHPGQEAGAGGKGMMDMDMGMDKPMKKCRPKAGEHDPMAGNAAPHDPMMPGHDPPPPPGAAGEHAPPPPPSAAGNHAPPPPPPAAGDHAPPPPPAAGHPAPPHA